MVMSIEKLKRVLQRVRERNPGKVRIPRAEFERCILVECGTSPATYRNNMIPLVKLGWVKRQKNTIVITGKDITDF